MALCGATTRSGEPCRKHALNGETRCRLHGGAAAKANKGKQYAKKHGIYSDVLSDEDKAIWDEIELGKVDDELKLCRIRLRRAVLADQQQASSEDGLELDSMTKEPPIVGGLPLDDEQPIVKKAYKRRDYSAAIDRLTGRIESLERTRMELMKSEPPEDVPVTKIEIEVVSGKSPAPAND